MNNLDKIISFVTAVFGLCIALFPNLSLYWKITLILILLVIVLSILYIKSRYDYAKLMNKFKDKSEKHTALAIQFDKKSKIISKHCTALNNISNMFLLALQSSNNAKIEILYKIFLENQQSIDMGGNENE